MDRRIVFFGVVVAIAIGLLAIFAWTGDRHDGWDRTEVSRVVTTTDGETLVIQEGGHRGFFPFFPLFLVFPLFWILVVGGFFSFFGRRRWGGGPPYGPGPQDRDAWLADWHRRQHGPLEPPPAPTPDQSPPGM